MKLMTGTVIAQIIPIAITPILSRYFTPEDFGVYAVFTSITAILIIFSTGRLEFAIMLPKKDLDANKIVVVIIGFGLLFALLIYLILLIGGNVILSAVKLDALRHVKFLLPLSVFFAAANIALKYLKNRKQSFSTIRNVTILGSTTRGSLNVAFALLNPIHIGLIINQALSFIASFLLLIRKEIHEIYFVVQEITLKDSIAVVKRHIKLIYYLVPGGIINTFAVQLPVLFIAFFYNENEVGQFSMAQRLISVPLVFIMTAFSDTFRQLANDLYRDNGSNRKFFLKNVLRLCIIGIIPFIMLYIFAPQLFQTFLGSQWVEAGKIVRILTLMFYVKFVLSGLSGVVIQVAEKYQYEILYQVLFLILSSGGFIIGHLIFNNLYYALAFYSIAAILMYFLSFLLAYKVSKEGTVI